MSRLTPSGTRRRWPWSLRNNASELSAKLARDTFAVARVSCFTPLRLTVHEFTSTVKTHNDGAFATPVDQMTAALREAGILANGSIARLVPLTGGVSSAIFRVDLPGGPICIKQALETLRVAAEWHAPVERSASEVAWIREVASIDDSLVPHILFADDRRHLFAMAYLEPDTHPCWKPLLAGGTANSGFAGKVGDALGRIHASTASSAALARQFAHAALFEALRIDPYLVHAAKLHQDLAPQLHMIADGLRASRRALVHGDVSPKNILCGPRGPVFLDAECACFGEPAFDLSFCLCHLLLKGVWHPEHGAGYARCADALIARYRPHVDWEDWTDFEPRGSRLLAALLLARVDGKSPVEYLTDDGRKSFVRDFARSRLAGQTLSLDDLRKQWWEGTSLL